MISTVGARIALGTVMAWFRFRLALWGALVSCLSNGCTLIGAGIGAAVDSAIPGPYEEHTAMQRVRISPGDRVRIGLRNGRRVEGKYLGPHGPTATDPESYLVVENDDTATLVRVSELSTIGTEVTGKGWLYGGLIGLAIDVTVVVVTIIAFSNMNWSQGEHNLFGGNTGCLC